MSTNATETLPRLSDEELVKLLQVMKGVDSVELKVTLPASETRTVIRALDMDPVEAQPRQVFFFDTPDLALNAAGVVVRARRVQGGRGDTVIKLRPVVPEELSAELRRQTAFNVEVDVIPGGFVCSASFKGRTTGQEIRGVVNGATPLRKIFSKEQRAFFAEHAPEGINLDGLTTLGPTFVLKLAFEPTVIGRRMVAELWFYPDGSRVFELSTKCLPSEAFQVAAEARAYLASNGVKLGGEQATKTKTALEFFRDELKASAATT
ncbi:MAG TPA: hypothetical protein VIH00_05010 [Candidatus Limnocylindrales bacterium]